jgi:hypothetical protein
MGYNARSEHQGDIMTDLLFIELGAVVTGFPAPDQCTIEPFCDPNSPPTYYDPTKWYTVDFKQLLDIIPQKDTAQYDQIVYPMTGCRVAIGPKWPGGGYEGILCVRYNLVASNSVDRNPVLGAAADMLDGPVWRYQVIASIDQDTGTVVRRYHGFPAQVFQNNGTIKFQIVNRNDKITDTSITFDPNASDKDENFYAGDLVSDNDNIVSGNVQVGDRGAVFINLEKLPPNFTGGDELPKLPPSAGL